jgi:hypothetical protein
MCHLDKLGSFEITSLIYILYWLIAFSVMSVVSCMIRIAIALIEFVVSLLGYICKWFHYSTNEEIDKKQYDGFVISKSSKNITVLIQSQTVCREIFSKDITGKPTNLNLGDLFHRWLGFCMGCLDSRDSNWSALKKIFKPLFDHCQDSEKVKSIKHLLMEEWDTTLFSLYDESRRCEEPISIERVVDNLALRYVLRILFGANFTKLYEKELLNLQLDAATLMIDVFKNDISKYSLHSLLPTKINGILRNFIMNWNILLKNAEESEFVKKDGIYFLLLDNYNRSNIKWIYFSQTLMEILFANQDVTNPSLAWLLVNYSLNASSRSKVEHFIEESARICPVSEFSMPKTATKDHVIQECLIREGSHLVVDFQSLGYSREWGMNDLNNFRPERFDEISHTDFISRFGYGSRRCPGFKLTNYLFKCVIEHLRTKWILLPSNPTQSLSNIRLDPSKAFRSPLLDIWLFPTSWDCGKSLYYNCLPTAEKYHNAFMAVSVNKRSTFLSDSTAAERVVKYLNYRSKFGDEPRCILIVICDDIAQYNFQAFENYKPNKAIDQASKLGDVFMKIFQDAISKLDDSNFVSLCRWLDIDGIRHEDSFLSLGEDSELNRRVSVIADRFIRHRAPTTMSTYESKVSLVKLYIFSELQVLINGVCYKGTHYRLLYYCGSKDHLQKFAEDPLSLHNLVMDIYTDPKFRPILNKIRQWSFNGKSKVPGFIGIQI